MITGVRRPEELRGLGLSNRLMVRVGALLKKKLAVTLAVLESAPKNPAFDALLLDPQLLEHADKLDAAHLQALSATHFKENPPQLALASAADGVRVLCLQEELDAADGWGEPASAGAQVKYELSSSAAQQSSPRAAVEGLFSREAMDRLRLKLATAATINERLEALRTLMLAPAEKGSNEKVEVLLQGLSDRDPQLRAEAATLLASLGADVTIAETLANLNHADRARRLAAAEKLQVLLKHPVRDFEIGSIAISVLAQLKGDPDAEFAGKLLELLGVCAPALGRNPERLAEIVRLQIGLVATAARQRNWRDMDKLLVSAQRLIRGLGEAVPKALLPVLIAERERCSERVCESFLLQSLLDLVPVNDAAEAPVLQMAVAFLATDSEEGRDSRAVGARLRRRGEAALRLLCDAFPTATVSGQKYFLLLLDDLWRQNQFSDELVERAAQLILQCIESGTISLRLAAMNCRLAGSPQISEGLREKLAEAFLNSLGDFIFPFDLEKAEGVVLRMGLPAVKPLLQRIGAEHGAGERVRAVRMLGDLSLQLRPPPGQMPAVQKAVTDILRKLQALTLEADFPDYGELLASLGKLAGCPAASAEAGNIVARTLLEAASDWHSPLMPRGLEGLSFLASSRRAPPELVNKAAELLKRALEETPFDVSTSEGMLRGEKVIEISGGEQYTTLLPIILNGLSRVACSSSCPAAVTRDVGKLLIDRWKRICNAEIVWGPGNTALVVLALKQLCLNKNCSAEQRLEVLKLFGPRHEQSAILQALAEILEADDTPATARMALALGVTILGRRDGDGRFPMEDREDILRALKRLAGRQSLGGAANEDRAKAAAFRKMALDELFKGVKDAVPNMYEALVALRENANLAPELRADIDRRLKEFNSLAAR